jgi:hypothetical protein
MNDASIYYVTYHHEMNDQTICCLLFSAKTACESGPEPMSVVVISLLVAGLLAAGNASAREYEERTMRGLLLAPVRLWHILAGRILGAFLISLPSVAIVMAVVAPAHPSAAQARARSSPATRPHGPSHPRP